MSISRQRSRQLAERLRVYEQRNVTFIADDFPIFWESAHAAVVRDVDGNEYIDCTAAFGVANAGHGNAHVAEALAQQARLLMHGMGDIHPTELRVRLLERLATILPSELNRTFLATTGSEAVEAALKTAILATGRSRFAAFHGGYHGLSFGALAVGGIERFRAPFAAAIEAQPILLDYPREGETPCGAASTNAHDSLAARSDVAALIVEPIQGRAGCIVPPAGYLAALRRSCSELGIVMIADEIYTGFGRTGRWFAVENEGVVPDIICVGKAMGSGVPISAAIGRAEIMDAWPLSSGEALHTSTYLGNPLGCAAALATIDELQRLDLPARAAQLGAHLERRLDELRTHSAVVSVRGRGLFWGVELRDGVTAFAVVKDALARGVILLQSGLGGETIAITPPLVISLDQLDAAVDAFTLAIGAFP